MKAIVRWCLNNKSIVALGTVLLVVSGVYAATQLNEELLPDVEFPLLTVTTPVPGAGPEVVDEQVTQPLESAVESVEGIESVRGTSAQGFSSLLVEFDLGTDSQEAEDELNRVIADVALPEQAQDPEVQSQGITAIPVLSVSVSAADGDLEGLTEYVRDEVIPDIEEVEGVASADLVGGSEERLRVDLDLGALEENGLPPEAVVAAISGANTNAPAGSVEIDGLETPIRTTSSAATAEDLENLPISAAALAGAPTGGSPAAAPEEAPPGAAPEGLQAGETPAPGGAAAAPPEPVLLSEVAEVSEVESNLAGISRSDGEPSLGLNVVKEQGSNTVEVAESVEVVLDDVRDELGEGQVNTIFNSAEDVQESVDSLIEKALLGGALAIFVIFLFLRSVKATLVTAISLPTSILAALLFSWTQDLTLNIITLAGLTIAVGRVVDDAIVVLENSYRYIQQGYSPEEAALRGTTEVASAITSSTLTTVAVFLPLGLVGGIISEFFLPLSLTVALALIASLIVALTIIPVLISLFISRKVASEAPDVEPVERRPARQARRRRASGPFGAGLRLLLGGTVFLLASVACAALAVLFGLVAPEDVLGSNVVLAFAAALAGLLAVGLVLFIVRLSRGTAGSDESGADEEAAPARRRGGGMVGLYTPMLLWSLRHRALVILFAFIAFAGGLAVIPFLSVSFFPPSEERLLSAQVETRSGNSVTQTAEELQPFEDFLLDDRGVENYQLSVGGEDPFSATGGLRPDNEAQSFISVAEDADVNRVFERVSEEGDRLYGEAFQVQILSQGPQTGGLEVTVTGGDEAELREASDLVVEELQDVEGLANIQSDIASESPEVSISVNGGDAAAAGVSPSSLATSLGTLLGEQEIDLDGTPVVVGVPEGEVDSLDAIRDLPAGSGVTVGEVAEVEQSEAPSAIGRSDGERAVTVSARITSEDTNAVSSEVGTALEDLDLPGEVTAAVGGESEDIAQSFRDLVLSIVVALALVYLVLVVFFRSLVVPLVILLAVPLTTVGAFGALLLTGTTLSVPSLLGVLLLIGIVVANAILLIDFVTNAARGDVSLDEAIVEAGRARLRPILMTALATIFALVPLAVGLGGGGNVLISSSLAIPVIGGLITSTLLTLIVVPVGYSLLREPFRKHRPETSFDPEERQWR
ncbi:AcrB/AcrD/AcrF family [Rubrobacter radiotolerans]|uniref:AcrB/AcrD/AcrF family n=1 Tax=Rubrobacter radiotolerans TaxID=42256 RepID=A0A023X6W4_RUBRA|nr:efflux RND transporter permease subunit [Rubrobacter radiotolerans]AHY47814.1 AcrB/AcrD/AcrF family [Rubrobacter radiotolerans]MDX5892453.1 efflux RND transporter permease subunit [Rubrobacter radiotolerans]SMC07744.1 AcrB/AcrD/AcrF family protein [Rubrobacter radiotolerans DSM 5868]